MPDFFGKLKSGAEKVAFEADKLARVNRAQGELGQVKRQIESQMLKLGELYYQHYQTQEAEGPEFAEICQKIAALEGQAAVKNEEVKQINAEEYGVPSGAPSAPAPAPAPAAAPASASVTYPETPEVSAVEPAVPLMGERGVPVAPAAPQVRACPNCGREISAAQKFCPDCGTKL